VLVTPPVALFAAEKGLDTHFAPSIDARSPTHNIRQALNEWDWINHITLNQGCFDLAVVVSFGYFIVS
jgi:hypothetical protein